MLGNLHLLLRAACPPDLEVFLAPTWFCTMVGCSRQPVARYTAGCLATDDPDTPIAVAVAASLCSDVSVLAAEECVQLHGGLGFTWEHPAHLWLKRAKADQLALGTPDRHRAALATMVDLPSATES